MFPVNCSAWLIGERKWKGKKKNLKNLWIFFVSFFIILIIDDYWQWPLRDRILDLLTPQGAKPYFLENDAWVDSCTRLCHTCQPRPRPAAWLAVFFFLFFFRLSLLFSSSPLPAFPYLHFTLFNYSTWNLPQSLFFFLTPSFHCCWLSVLLHTGLWLHLSLPSLHHLYAFPAITVSSANTVALGAPVNDSACRQNQLRA